MHLGYIFYLQSPVRFQFCRKRDARNPTINTLGKTATAIYLAFNKLKSITLQSYI